MNWRGVLSMLAMLALVCGQATAADWVDPRTLTRFPIPERYQLVNDHAGFLRIARRVEIARRLEALEKSNGTQIVFLSVPNSGDKGLDAYAYEVIAQWDIGNNGQHNGVLFLASPQGWQVYTAPGIAGALPDVTLARINRNITRPAFERGDLSEGIEATIDALIKAAQPEVNLGTNYDYAHPYTPMTTEQTIAWGLGVLGVVYGAALVWQRRRKRKLAPT